MQSMFARLARLASQRRDTAVVGYEFRVRKVQVAAAIAMWFFLNYIAARSRRVPSDEDLLFFKIVSALIIILVPSLWNMTCPSMRERRAKRALLEWAKKAFEDDQKELSDKDRELLRKAYPWRNLVFEGGGVKGIAYTGALEVLNQAGILNDIERVAGTSAGAMTALLLGVGYSPKDIAEMLYAFDLPSLLDAGYVPLVEGPWRLFCKHGVARGELIRQYLAEKVALKTGDPLVTFQDIENFKTSRPGEHYRSMEFFGTNLSTGMVQRFSVHTTPDMPVVNAVRISLSIPGVFEPVKWGDKNDVFVDGGVLLNFPLAAFDKVRYMSRRRDVPRLMREHSRANLVEPDAQNPADPEAYCYNPETLGLRLDSLEELLEHRHGRQSVDKDLTRTDLGSIPKFGVAILSTLQKAQDVDFFQNVDNAKRTVFISTGRVSATDFHLTLDLKQILHAQGRVGTRKFLKNHCDLSSGANRTLLRQASQLMSVNFEEEEAEEGVDDDVDGPRPA